jgi:hypothetical protein
MGLDERLASTFVAANDAPPIGERAATRGRSKSERGDEHALRESVPSVRAPASRTGANAGNLDAFGGRSADGGAYAKTHSPAT